VNANRPSYDLAQELAAAHKTEAALLAFEAAAREKPDDFKPVFGGGLMQQRLGDHADAVAAFSRVLDLAPRLAEAHYSRALSLRELGRAEEALRDLEAALALKPDYIDARCALGTTLKRLERFDEAIAAFTSVIAASGVHPAASHGRATLRHRAGDFAGAIEDIDVCLAHGMDNYDLRLLRGLAAHYLGRHTEALDDLTRAIAFQPQTGSTYVRRWQVYRALGDEARAGEDFRRANELMAQ
jgi:tetratricopeptide (TPR) repeat protein